MNLPGHVPLMLGQRGIVVKHARGVRISRPAGPARLSIFYIDIQRRRAPWGRSPGLPFPQPTSFQVSGQPRHRPGPDRSGGERSPPRAVFLALRRRCVGLCSRRFPRCWTAPSHTASSRSRLGFVEVSGQLATDRAGSFREETGSIGLRVDRAARGREKIGCSPLGARGAD